MPGQLRKQVLGRVPGNGVPGRCVLGCAVALVALPALGAESLPASVRACASITDSLQRLVCYDREVARFPAPEAKSTSKPAPAAKAVASAGNTTAAPSGSGAGAAVSAASGQATSSSATPAAGTNTSTAAAAPPAADAADNGHVSAHIVSIDRLPDEMVLHLDNGQVWQEVQSVSGDLSLREGDAVKIDRHFGSYWLSGPHVSSMKVRLKI